MNASGTGDANEQHNALFSLNWSSSAMTDGTWTYTSQPPVSGPVSTLDTVAMSSERDQHMIGTTLTYPEILTHADLPGVSIRLEMITPDVAQKYLDLNSEGQRNLNSDVSGRYAEDMLTENWPFTGAPVLFDSNGDLIDGQHRLNAIVESETSQLTLVITGLAPGVMRAVDAGRKRTYGTYLQMPPLSRPNYTNQAAIIRACWYWMVAGNYGDRSISRLALPSELIHVIPTISQMESCRVAVERDLGITFTAAAKFSVLAYSQLPRITVTVWGLVWVLLTEYDVDLREKFFHELLKEASSTAADFPPNALRNRLMRQREPLTRTVQLHMVLRTFNAWRTGVSLQTVSAPVQLTFNTLAMPPVKEDQ